MCTNYLLNGKVRYPRQQQMQVLLNHINESSEVPKHTQKRLHVFIKTFQITVKQSTTRHLELSCYAVCRFLFGLRVFFGGAFFAFFLSLPNSICTRRFLCIFTHNPEKYFLGKECTKTNSASRLCKDK